MKRNVKVEVYQRAMREAASLGYNPLDSHGVQDAVLARRQRLWERFNPRADSRSESEANRWLSTQLLEWK